MHYYKYAGMAELADALDSGSSDFTVIQVQVLLPAPKIDKLHQKLVGFSFVSIGHNIIGRSPHHFERSENIIVRLRTQMNDVAASRK